jgi:hypothetical protein
MKRKNFAITSLFVHRFLLHFSSTILYTWVEHKITTSIAQVHSLYTSDLITIWQLRANSTNTLEYFYYNLLQFPFLGSRGWKFWNILRGVPFNVYKLIDIWTSSNFVLLWNKYFYRSRLINYYDTKQMIWCTMKKINTKRIYKLIDT